MHKRSLALALAAVMCGPKPDLSHASSIQPFMQLRPNATASNEFDLMIYGLIGESWWDDESVEAKSVVDQLNALSPSVTQINVRINSVGGSVHDALAIYNALKRHPAAIAVTVDGIAMSAASFIAMAGDTVHMPATCILMIHAPSTFMGGNAADLRTVADALDTYAASMAPAYVAKTGQSADAIMALLTDGQDHYYTGEQAVAGGFADAVIAEDDLATDPVPAAARAAMIAGLDRFISSAPQNVQQMAIAAVARTPAAGQTARAIPPIQTPAPVAALTTAVSADSGDTDMKLRKLFAAGFRNKLGAEGGEGGGGVAPDAAAIQAQAHATLRTRNTDIKAVLDPYMSREGISALYLAALEDPSATVDSVRAQALNILGAASEPLGGTMRVQNGQDESEKIRSAGEQILLARAGILKGADAERARQGNPFARATLVGMAEQMLVRAGVNTRHMSREDMARTVLASGSQTTSDFPLLLENVLNKILVGGYNLAAFTWTRFCTTGTLSDYRPHGRYHLSSFSDLKVVNEAGEYENGVLGDGAKESITAQRKGRILEITPEVLINDDLGAFTRIAAALGQAAGRTIEKDVYALFALNDGAGPTMSDGKPLFHANHNNIAATAAAPTVTSFDAARQQMAQQMDVGGNDFLDIRPAVWLGPTSLGGDALVLNEAQYDVGVSNKFQVPNRVRGLFRDVVDTPRLSGAAWYAFADAGMEPVFEVGFLDGVSTPTLQQDTNFRTDGLAWKAVHRYGVAAIGWRGAIKNAGQ